MARIAEERAEWLKEESKEIKSILPKIDNADIVSITQEEKEVKFNVECDFFNIVIKKEE